MQDFSVALVGLGGFGDRYVRALLSEGGRRFVTFAAGIDPAPERCSVLADIRRHNVPLYRDLESYLALGSSADLIVLATPLQLHCRQMVQALEAGSHVLCEKPLGASIGDIGRVIQAREEAKKAAAIAYQWSFSPTTQRLKRDILSGRLGTPRRFATMTCWPRNWSYYGRNGWAGKVRDEAGRPVLDSPANNACAHYLHHMFYLLGSSMESSAMPSCVWAELYRAYPIQNYDTAAIRCTTNGGVELLFLASHVTQNNRDPVCRFEFDEATVLFGETDDHVHVRFRDGTVEDYGSLPGGDSMDKFWAMIDSIRTGKPVVCGIEAAAAHTIAVCAAQQSVSEVGNFPAASVHREKSEGSYRLIVNELDQTLDRCYREFKMPAELGVPWARAGRPVEPEGLPLRRRNSPRPARQSVAL